MGVAVTLIVAFVALGAFDDFVAFLKANEGLKLGEIALAVSTTAIGAFCLSLGRLHRLSLEVQKRVDTEQEVTQMALHDSLTGLPNRRLFEDRMVTALARAKRGNEVVSVFMLDLDHFKPINDLHGHETGDRLLQAVASRVSGLLRDHDTFARFGGDEFAVLQIGAEESGDVVGLAHRLVAAMEEPFRIDNVSAKIGVSIGIALFPTDGTSPSELTRRADIALYRAKNSGRAGFCFFKQEMDAQLQERATIERDLIEAIENEQIAACYRPMVDLCSDVIIGFEAQAHWAHPQRGVIPIDVFLPVAEECGLISTLETAVLRRACKDALTWPSELTIAINVSPLQFRNRQLAEQILRVLEEEGLPSHRLEVQVAERALIDDPDAAAHIIHQLKSANVRFVLDDFGAGYSTLAYLRELPFDKIKIDRSFVGALQENAEGAAIVGAIIAMCQSLGLPTIADGIEQETHRSVLADQGCTLGQGVLFGKAISNPEIESLLGGWHCHADDMELQA